MSEPDNKQSIWGTRLVLSPECQVHHDHNPQMRDVEKAQLPDSFKTRILEGIAYEKSVDSSWAKILGASALPGRVLDACMAAEDFEGNVAVVAAELASEGIDIVWIPQWDHNSRAELRRWEVLTHAAMASRASFIWNPRLRSAGGRASEPDWLDRADTGDDGRARYRPGDVKNAKVLEGKSKPKQWNLSSMSSPSFDDAKAADLGPGSAKRDYILQLAHYHRHLQTIGHGVSDDNASGAILGSDGNIFWLDLNTPFRVFDVAVGKQRNTPGLDTYERLWASRHEVIEYAIKGDPHPRSVPRRRGECTSCSWRTWCREYMVAHDELTLLQGITPTNVSVHLDAGIDTRRKLAQLDWTTSKLMAEGVDVAQVVEDISGEDPNRLLTDTALDPSVGEVLAEAGVVTVADVMALDTNVVSRYQGRKVPKLSEHVDQARVTFWGEVCRKRDKKLDIPMLDVDIDVDMENDPGGIIYLWGTRTQSSTAAGLQLLQEEGIGNGEYRPFATFEPDDGEGEARAFIDMWEFLHRLIARGVETGVSVGAWCYTDAEKRCMNQLAKKHEGMTGMPTLAEIRAFDEGSHWIDLHKKIDDQTLWPTEDLSLKTTARWAGHEWRDGEAGGDASTVWYGLASAAKDASTRKENRTRVLRYNEDDVIATLVLREWLRERAKGDALPSVATLKPPEA